MKKLASLLFILLLSILAGCSQQTAKEPDSGVAAVVNGVEITKRQVEFLYQRSATPNMSAEDSANLKRRILADLIRIELLAEKGKEMKLDGTPDYSMALYAAQKSVLAGLAENGIARNLSPIADDQINSVVLNTPQLFAGRKLFVYDEVMFPGVDMPLLESLDKLAISGAPLSALLDELKAKKIPFNKTLIALTSEKISPQILSVLDKIKPNFAQVIAHKKENISMIVLLRVAYPAPIEAEPAKRAAKSMIASNQKSIALSNTMSELLDNAKITYYDEYAKTGKSNDKLSALPVPDARKAATKIYKKIYIGVISSASFILAVMTLTAILRSFYNTQWLPRLWPSASSVEHHISFYEIRYSTPVIQFIYLIIIVLVTIVALAYNIKFSHRQLETLIILACAVGGIVTGVFTSQLFNVGIALHWSKRAYIIVATLLALMIAFGTLATFRLSLF